MIIQICEKCDRFYMVHNPDSVLKKCPNCENEDLENIYGDDAHIWYLEGKLKVVEEKLALTEKALELAVEHISIYSDSCVYCEESWRKTCPCREVWGSKLCYEHLKKCLIEETKEIMKSE